MLIGGKKRTKIGTRGKDGERVAFGCCEGENRHAPTERIRVGSIVTGARQLRAVLQEVMELTLGRRGTDQ